MPRRKTELSKSLHRKRMAIQCSDILEFLHREREPHNILALSLLYVCTEKEGHSIFTCFLCDLSLPNAQISSKVIIPRSSYREK